MRCHEYVYIERMRKLCEGLAKEACAQRKAAVKAGDRHFAAELLPPKPLKASLDCDTEVTQHSYAPAPPSL